MQVTIYHNHDGGYLYYEPTHRVTPVFTYVTTRSEQRTLLREAWAICNSYPTEMHTSAGNRPIVAAYRALKLRSLCSGDIVQVESELFTVAASGFDVLGTTSAVALNIVPDPDRAERFAPDLDPVVTITRAIIEIEAQRAVTDEELERIAIALSHSTMPSVVGDVVHAVTSSE